VTQFSPPGRHIAVAAGYAFSLALTADGDVDAWGENDHGQLGHDTTRFEAMPRRVEGLKPAISAIAAGGTHALALTADATVFSWGSGSWGQLGSGERHDRPTPRLVLGISKKVVAIAAAEYLSLALLEDGSVMAWGAVVADDGAVEARPMPVRIAGLAEIVAISASQGGRSFEPGGGRHVPHLALDKHGHAWGWGPDRRKRISDETDRATAVRAQELPGAAAMLAAGHSHGLALIDGKVWGWGSNHEGPLGLRRADERRHTQPIAADGLPDDVAAIVTRGHTLALTEEGSVWACGPNGDGQLGIGTAGVPEGAHQLRGLGGPIKAVAVGETHTLALRHDGAVLGWGGPFQPRETDQEVAVGASKLGGEPDLVHGSDWPHFGGAPQTFVAQVDLADVASLGDEGLLPAAGLLSFFVVPDFWEDFDPADGGSYKVLFTEDTAELARIEEPAGSGEAARFSAVGLDAVLEGSLLPADMASVFHPELRDGQTLGSYVDLLWAAQGLDDEPKHRMLGHADTIQDDPRLTCEAARRGLGRAAAFADDEVRAQAADWQLLLQVDSDSTTGMEWSDAGALYFLIRTEDLRARRFSLLRGVHQSH
jgi:uncharacterized protein YwqG